MRNLWNLMNKIKYNFKKLFSFPRLVKFSVKSFLIKGRVVEHEMKLLIWKIFIWFIKVFLTKQVAYWWAILWNLGENILGFNWFKNWFNNLNSQNILVTDLNLSLLNINLKSCPFFWLDNVFSLVAFILIYGVLA